MARIISAVLLLAAVLGLSTVAVYVTTVVFSGPEYASWSVSALVAAAGLGLVGVLWLSERWRNE